jgi:hypothetical protein
MTRRVLWMFLCASCICARHVSAQPTTPATPYDLRQRQSELNGRNCPGDPPGNLASFDCSFTAQMRFVEFASTSLTDQAVSSAAFFGGIGYWWHRDPPEWGRGWGSFGRSVGSRYTQNLAKGTVTLASSWAMHADPRHVSLASDPRSEPNAAAGTSARVGHAFWDWITVRISKVDGKGSRWPNVPLVAGAAASGLVSNALLPSGTATVKSAVVTASSSLATALASSFYTEFSPELGSLLGGIVKRGRASPPSPPAKGSVP